MSGDFLDNLTQRLGAPESLPIQPRLASRFEESSPADATGPAQEPMEDIEEPGAPRIARIAPTIPSETRSVSTVSDVKSEQHHENPSDVPVPRAAPEIPEWDPHEDDHDSDTESLESRLDAISRELDRLAGRIDQPVASPEPKRVELAHPQGSTPDEFPDPEPVAKHQTTIERWHDGEAPRANETPLFDVEDDRRGEPPPRIFIREAGGLPEREDDEASRDTSAPEIVTSTVVSPPASETRETPIPEIRPQTEIDRTQRAERSVPEIIVESPQTTAAADRTVNVTIGRIEIRAVPSTPVASPRRVRSFHSSLMSLDDYLSRRNGGVR